MLKIKLNNVKIIVDFFKKKVIKNKGDFYFFVEKYMISLNVIT